MTGDVAVVIAQRGQVLLERADGGAGGAELHVRAGRRAGRAARAAHRRGDRVKRSRARNAVRRQTLGLLESLDGRLGLAAEVAGDFRVIVTELLKVGLQLADLRALAVELERRACAAAGSGRAALSGDSRRDGIERLGACNAVGGQAVLFLEALDGGFRLRAKVAGDFRPVIAERRQILLKVANVCALRVELEAACRRRGRARRGFTGLALIGRVDLRDGLRAGDAVGGQAVFALKALDGRDGLFARVAGNLAAVIVQRLEFGLNALDRLAAGVLADIGVIRIGRAGLALRRGKRADRLAGHIAAAHLELALGLFR